MFGKESRGRIYYICRPKRAHLPEGHPPSIRVREEPLIKGLSPEIIPNRQMVAHTVLGGRGGDGTGGRAAVRLVPPTGFEPALPP